MDEMELVLKLKQWENIAEKLIENKLPLAYKVTSETKDEEGNNIINVDFYDRVDVMNLIKSCKLKPIVSQSFNREKYKVYEDAFINPCGFTEDWYIEDESLESEEIENEDDQKWSSCYDDIEYDKYWDLYFEIERKIDELPLEYLCNILIHSFTKWQDLVDIDLSKQRNKSYVQHEWNKLSKRLEDVKQKSSNGISNKTDHKDK